MAAKPSRRRRKLAPAPGVSPHRERDVPCPAGRHLVRWRRWAAVGRAGPAAIPAIRTHDPLGYDVSIRLVSVKWPRT